MPIFAFVDPAPPPTVTPATGQVTADFVITNDAVLTIAVSAFVLGNGGSRLPVVIFC